MNPISECLKEGSEFLEHEIKDHERCLDGQDETNLEKKDIFEESLRAYKQYLVSTVAKDVHALKSRKQKLHVMLGDIERDQLEEREQLVKLQE